MSKRFIVAMGAACLVSGFPARSAWAAPTNSVAALAAECKTLTSVDFSSLTDAPTHLIDVKLVDAAGDVPLIAECSTM
ncbi:MAG: hypothetical protein ABI647_26805 [Gemmatimonadota bacterium]